MRKKFSLLFTPLIEMDNKDFNCGVCSVFMSGTCMAALWGTLILQQSAKHLLSESACEAGQSYYPHCTDGNLKHRETKWLPQGHIGKSVAEQFCDANPSLFRMKIIRSFHLGHWTLIRMQHILAAAIVSLANICIMIAPKGQTRSCRLR